MAYYQGSAGGIITTHHELLRLAENRKSVCIFNGIGTITTVLPASSLLHRPFGDVIKMLQSGTWHEYIKPVRPNIQRKFYKRKKLSQKEKIELLVTALRNIKDMEPEIITLRDRPHDGDEQEVLFLYDDEVKEIVNRALESL